MSKNETLNLEVFDNPEFGQMRILREGDKYLFCANDAAVALGYSNPRAALQRHCKGVAKRDTLTPGGVQSLSYIAEGDLYRLIIHSKLPSAEKFEHWVFEEVLPCIRKTGGYMTDNLLTEIMNEPDIIYKVTSDMLKERGQRMRLESEAKAAKPKVEYFDSFITAEDCTNIRTTAKEIQVPERQFVAWLLKNKYLYRTATGYLMPYAKKSNEGLFIVKDFYYGYGQIAHHTLITPNGKLLFMRLASRIRESAWHRYRDPGKGCGASAGQFTSCRRLRHPCSIIRALRHGRTEDVYRPASDENRRHLLSPCAGGNPGIRSRQLEYCASP